MPVSYRIRTPEGAEYEVASPADAKKHYPTAEILYAVEHDAAGNPQQVEYRGKQAPAVEQAMSAEPLPVEVEVTAEGNGEPKAAKGKGR